MENKIEGGFSFSLFYGGRRRLGGDLIGIHKSQSP